MTDMNESPATKPDESGTRRPSVSPGSGPEPELLKFIASRINASNWIGIERAEYADVKYDTEKRKINDYNMEVWGLAEEGEWWVFLTNYLRRAQLLGVDTFQGRQAFGKFVVTAMSAFESMIRVKGLPPTPGVHSGKISAWITNTERGNEDG